MTDAPLLAAALGRFLDEVPAERERLEEYVDTLTPAQRLRLAGALHLVSHRLDEDLADPEQREALRAA